MISTAALTLHRAIADKALPDTATLSRPTRTPDGMGGWTDAYSPVGTYACRVGRYPITPREAEVGAEIQTVAYYTITFSATSGPAVQQHDRIAVGSRTFEVVSAAEVSYQVAYGVLCVEVD